MFRSCSVLESWFWWNRRLKIASGDTKIAPVYFSQATYSISMLISDNGRGSYLCSTNLGRDVLSTASVPRTSRPPSPSTYVLSDNHVGTGLHRARCGGSRIHAPGHRASSLLAGKSCRKLLPKHSSHKGSFTDLVQTDYCFQVRWDGDVHLLRTTHIIWHQLLNVICPQWWKFNGYVSWLSR